VVRTYLRIAALDAVRPGRPTPARAHLEPLPPGDLATWRALYARIGGPWHWHDRDAWDDARLATYLSDPAVRTWCVEVPDDGQGQAHHDAGLLELCQHPDGSVEIVYLGLHESVSGRGLGAWLVCEAIARGFALGASSVWLHTCTLDGPAALPNYLARGFVIERTETYEATLPG
jgi:GNAT superfamily N-acetyltransferase